MRSILKEILNSASTNINRTLARFGSPKITPRQSLEVNGFYAFRGLFTEIRCKQIAHELRSQARFSPGERAKAVVDAANRLPQALELAFDRQLLNAVRACIGDDIRFLQVSDYIFNRDSPKWHRDSACKKLNQPDWDESGEPYRVVKLILYLEIDNAGLGIVPGSHNRKGVIKEVANDSYDFIRRDDLVDRFYYAGGDFQPTMFVARPGDVFIFDERLYHCGLSTNAAQTEVVTSSSDSISPSKANKSTIAFCYGPPNLHSRRFYSYFRFVRSEMGYKDMNAELVTCARNAGVLPNLDNLFLEDSTLIEKVWMRNPELKEELKKQFLAASRS